MTTNEPEFKVGDTVRPNDHRRGVEGMTFTIDSEAQIMYHERMKRFLFLTAPNGGVGFLAEELEPVLD